MRRFAAAVILLLCLIPAVVCTAAEKDFTCAYTPKSANSTVFYIDIYSKNKVTAAVFELRFDPETVRYDAAAAVSNTASVRDNPQSGTVKLAFVDSAPADGQLCRLSFKAIQAGTTDFVLHTEQAADANRQKLTSFDDDTLTVTLGKDDVVSVKSSSASRSSSASSGTSSGSQRGEKSSLITDSERATSDELPSGGVFDLRKDRGIKYMLLGAGIVILFAALVFIGVIIGRRTASAKQQKKEEPPSQETEEDEE